MRLVKICIGKSIFLQAKNPYEFRKQLSTIHKTRRIVKIIKYNKSMRRSTGKTERNSYRHSQGSLLSPILFPILFSDFRIGENF